MSAIAEHTTKVMHKKPETDPVTYADDVLGPYVEAAETLKDSDALDLLRYGQAAYIDDCGHNTSPIAKPNRLARDLVFFLAGALIWHLVMWGEFIARRPLPNRARIVCARKG